MSALGWLRETRLWIILAAIVAAIIAFVTGRRSQTKETKAAEDARAAAKAKRDTLNDALDRKDDDAVQRESMKGVKPLNRGGPLGGGKRP